MADPHIDDLHNPRVMPSLAQLAQIVADPYVLEEWTSTPLPDGDSAQQAHAVIDNQGLVVTRLNWASIDYELAHDAMLGLKGLGLPVSALWVASTAMCRALAHSVCVWWSLPGGDWELVPSSIDVVEAGPTGNASVVAVDGAVHVFLSLDAAGAPLALADDRLAYEVEPVMGKLVVMTAPYRVRSQRVGPQSSRWLTFALAVASPEGDTCDCAELTFTRALGVIAGKTKHPALEVATLLTPGAA